jgi:hypothetical protein
MALWYTTVVQSTGTATAFAIGPIDYSYGADVLHLEHIFDTWGYGCPETHQVRRVARAIPSLRLRRVIREMRAFGSMERHRFDE